MDIGRSVYPGALHVRPRGGNFVYFPYELEVIARDIKSMRNTGVHAVATGVLTPEATVNVDAMRRLVDMAYPMRVCFHRAFAPDSRSGGGA